MSLPPTPPPSWDTAWNNLLVGAPLALFGIVAGWCGTLFFGRWKRGGAFYAGQRHDDRQFDLKLMEVADGAIKDVLKMLWDDRKECREKLARAEARIDVLEQTLTAAGVPVPPAGVAA